MNIIGIIPARWASTRLEGKVLADILGKPMIQHVWERAKQSRLLNEVYIACDEKHVFDAVEKFHAKAIMTASQLACGTDRVAEAARGLQADIILNIQGDEPLISADVLDALAKVLRDDPTIPMATVIRPCTDMKEIESPNVVKVVIDHNQDALYFSRSIIPYFRDASQQNKKFFKHLGIYGYRKEFLIRFKDLPPSALEQAEKLEQLRALEAGIKIRTVETDYDTVSVDTSADLMNVIALMKNK